MQKPLIILGIDPGTVILGYSIIEVSGSSIQVKAIDCLKLSSKKDNYQKLELIYNHILQIIEQFAPDEFAIEAPFFGKNVQSMLKLGRAQGVAIAAAMTRHIPVTEYSPKKVKQSITGNGNADKEQIWKMLQKITYLPDKPKYFDATDALAVAICHHFNNKVPELNSAPGAKKVKANGWEKFIKQNPGRIYK
ncbi:MAG: crossover junction endodeoxyribonuclease RuvC [Flavisolibacter sp.]